MNEKGARELYSGMENINKEVLAQSLSKNLNDFITEDELKVIL